MLASRLAQIRTSAADKALTRKDAQAFITELCDVLEKRQKRQERSQTFTLADVMTEAEKRKWKPGAAEAFYDHYEMVGWVYGKCRHPIRKLGAAMSTWERTAKNGSAPVEGKQSTLTNNYGVEG